MPHEETPTSIDEIEGRCANPLLWGKWIATFDAHGERRPCVREEPVDLRKALVAAVMRPRPLAGTGTDVALWRTLDDGVRAHVTHAAESELRRMLLDAWVTSAPSTRSLDALNDLYPSGAHVALGRSLLRSAEGGSSRATTTLAALLAIGYEASPPMTLSDVSDEEFVALFTGRPVRVQAAGIERAHTGVIREFADPAIFSRLAGVFDRKPGLIKAVEDRVFGDDNARGNAASAIARHIVAGSTCAGLDLHGDGDRITLDDRVVQGNNREPNKPREFKLSNAQGIVLVALALGEPPPVTGTQRTNALTEVRAALGEGALEGLGARARLTGRIACSVRLEAAFRTRLTPKKARGRRARSPG